MKDINSLCYCYSHYLRLRQFIVVMRKLEVNTTSVNIQ